MVSRIGLGCMRIADIAVNDIETLIHTAMGNGINFFDHADIYGSGKSEEQFAKAFSNTSYKRDQVIIQSKCGIRRGFYDFSKEYILKSVDDILMRLNMEYLDILLLHRPDALAEPEEVAEALDKLESSGKVREFGISNHNAGQIELLQKSVSQKLKYNQLQFSLKHTGIIDSGINVNMKVEGSIDKDGGILDYCRLKDITIQAWSPFQYGFFDGVFLGNKKFPELNEAIDDLSEKYNVSNNAIAVAWILRHPAGIQTIVGSTNPQRVADMAKALDIEMGREEWYDLYRAAGNNLP